MVMLRGVASRNKLLYQTETNLLTFDLIVFNIFFYFCSSKMKSNERKDRMVDMDLIRAVLSLVATCFHIKKSLKVSRKYPEKMHFP